MRKPILVIASLMLAITALASPIGKTMGDVIDIPILNPEDQPGGRPRSVPPFSASLDTSQNSLLVNALYNVGYVDVVIENLSTGESAEFYFNSAVPTFFPISGNAGNWRITLTLGNGEEYIGEFVI